MIKVSSRFPDEFRWIAALVAMAFVSGVAALVAGARVGVPTAEIYAGYTAAIWTMVPAIILFALLIYLIWCAALRVERPIRHAQPFLAARFGSADKAAGTIGPILLMPLLMGAFGTLKQLLPLVNPFGWDNAFAQMGLLLFGGVRPWRVTHALFGSPMATMILDRIYTGWIAVLFVAALGFAAFAAPRLRARFFLSFGAGWLLLGVVAAYFFSSAGPCYSVAIGAEAAPDYALLMARLRAIDASGYPISALYWQDYLWKAQQSHQYGFALGVSAMPSMHNAISFLYVLAAARSRWWVRAASWLFATAILIGSVHLGWHYLVDGLIGWAGMTLIWSGAGAYLRWSGYQAAPALRLVAAPDGPETAEQPALLAA